MRLRRACAREATAALLPGSALIVAPHPDDETIGCGLLTAAKVARGEHVTVVLATDGGLGWFGGGPAPPPAELAAIRSLEWHAALDALGVPAGDRVELGHPDGHLADCEDAVVDSIAGLLADLRPTQVFCPAPDDLHADHRALARATLRAVAPGISGSPGPALFGYRVYPGAGLWPTGAPGQPSGPGAVLRLVRSLPGLAGDRDLALHAPEAMAAKSRAIGAHVSQRSLLTGALRDVWGTGTELYRPLARSH
jgi:LmbE family N-acetylglucosaminyl deacetylase